MTNENHWEDFSLSNKTAKTGLHYCRLIGVLNAEIISEGKYMHPEAERKPPHSGGAAFTIPKKNFLTA